MTLRNALFQTHWLLGITAGIVLALVGVTGAMLSFEDEILKAINPGVMTVTPREPALAPAALVERIRAQRPDYAIQSLTLSADPRDSARVGFAPRADAPAGPGGRKRGESRQVDPYTGALLAKPRGEGFFRTTMQLHRWLVMDDVGKQIVGFSTLSLVFFCLSGLYLRWPRRWGSLRTWLALDWRQKGRNVLWHLHSIVGTWVLLAYLVMALSGLTWSYGWYRDALNTFAGVPQKAEPRAGVARANQGEADDDAPLLDVAASWAAFARAVPDWSSATLQWPREGNGPQFRYLDADPAHERASNTLELDAATLAIARHARYDDKPIGQRLAGSYFALHRGSYFGLAGVIVFMLASLLMPLFAITGWMLYLDRRRSQRAARQLAIAASAMPPATGGERVLVAFASQSGTAERLAWQTAAALRDAGLQPTVRPLGMIEVDDLRRVGKALFVVSTFGDGEAPDHARSFARRMRAATPTLPALQYGVLALGDSSYTDYCGFGRTLEQWLHHAGAQPLLDRVDVDALDPAALRHWQHHLGVLTGNTDLPDWSAPAYARWRLDARSCANPGSPGAPMHHVALLSQDPASMSWQAGDIAEVGPRHGAAQVEAWLGAAQLDGAAPVQFAGASTTLASALTALRLPPPNDVRGFAAQAVVDAAKRLPHREYSIASVPADGSLQLLVREMRTADGSLGTGSGWLTLHAGIHQDIDLRIRRNPSFHPPEDNRPLVLVGNGTGIAGLRALLKARAARGHHRNWLLFGERAAAHDTPYHDEISRWLADGTLPHVDLAYSRSSTGGCWPDSPRLALHDGYVQDALHARAERLRSWVSEGAAVYVCGSLAGMAPGVEAVLNEVLGRDAVEAMLAAGRYRRDVY